MLRFSEMDSTFSWETCTVINLVNIQTFQRGFFYASAIGIGDLHNQILLLFTMTKELGSYE